ncbi:MAG: helix-turn-helix transcriptional regulator [Candidatus Gastranaerophilaceae bacterium]
MVNEKHIGSNFDDFLQEKGILEECEAVAIKRVLAFALQEKIKREKISLDNLAKELKTSRAAVNRILNPNNTSITLKTVEKVTKFLNKRLIISFA